jgi:hypothetical protein
LTIYLGVNVVAGALHHHHGTETQPDGWPNPSGTELQFQTSSPAEHAEEGEETCLLCSVLYLPQSLPATLCIETSAVLTGEAFCPAPITQSYPLQTSTHSRAPPLI